MTVKTPIVVNIINLKKRVDRYLHIYNQFETKQEFDFKVIEAFSHEVGAIGLWNTLLTVIKNADKFGSDFILVCEDDHLFTANYSYEILEKCIIRAKRLDADILLGGVSWFKNGIQVSDSLFWVEKFSGLQFTVIFKKFYHKIIESQFTEYDAADYKISSLSDKKFVIFPFNSIQKEFGYSDVTTKNTEVGRVEKLFGETSLRFDLLRKVRNFYLPDFK